MIEFLNHYIHPDSPSRAKIAIHLVAQATSDVSTKQISELVKTLDLDPAALAQAATDLQARLSAAGHDEAEEISGLRDYLVRELGVAQDKIDDAVEAWRGLHEQASRAKDGGEGTGSRTPPSTNGTVPFVIENVRDFKSRLLVSAGARPVKDLSEFEDLEPKL